jgi:hypothetical protein
MGVREPVTDWSVERTGVCPQCATTEFDLKDLEDSGIIRKPDEPDDDDFDD